MVVEIRTTKCTKTRKLFNREDVKLYPSTEEVFK